MTRCGTCSTRRAEDEEYLASCAAEERAGITILHFDEGHEMFPYIYAQDSVRARLPPIAPRLS